MIFFGERYLEVLEGLSDNDTILFFLPNLYENMVSVCRVIVTLT